MTKEADFYFDYGSPASYLAYIQLKGVAKRTGATIVYKPILLGGIFKATGNVSPMGVPAKFAWLMNDMKFFARRHDIDFKLNPHFPVNTVNLMRGAIYAQDQGFLIEYSDAVYKAIWSDEKNMEDPAVVRQVLNDAGIDADAVLSATQDPAVKESLKNETQAAVDRGLFGAPSLIIGDTLFFGQDRVPYAEELLA